jgi:hypothetical protein
MHTCTCTYMHTYTLLTQKHTHIHTHSHTQAHILSHAQVTDTTTFTSEARRQQEEAWLYETCTLCLQYLVDVFVLVSWDGCVLCMKVRL